MRMKQLFNKHPYYRTLSGIITVLVQTDSFEEVVPELAQMGNPGYKITRWINYLEKRIAAAKHPVQTEQKLLDEAEYALSFFEVTPKPKTLN